MAATEPCRSKLFLFHLWTDRPLHLRSLGVGLEPSDQRDPIPGLPLQHPVAQDSLHKHPLLLDRHLVEDGVKTERGGRERGVVIFCVVCGTL